MVVAVHNFGAGDVLEIAPQVGGETVMHPFSVNAVPSVDIARGRIVVVPPEDDTAAPTPATSRAAAAETN
jgi:16S rRNA processing protein RimM